MAKIDLNELRKREKYITCQKQPTLDLLIWNYNNPCQFDKAWDEYTMQCRGLITDLEGNIIARPFKKFFNLGEHESAQMADLPTDPPIIYEKLDGSLGIQYYDGDKVCIATRGSFTSDQALWATEWMKKQIIDRSDFNEKFTYLYEIIYPENRIVVNYGNRAELVLLAVIETETGGDNGEFYITEAERLCLPYVKHQAYTDLEKLIEETKKLDANHEGYVFHWPISNNMRAKIKGDEYVRLHRIISGVSTRSIWDALRNNSPLDEMLNNVPDEVYEWIKKERDILISQFNVIDNSVYYIFEEVKKLNSRKEQAYCLMKYYKELASVVFAKLDGKDYKKIVWKMIQPKWRPFMMPNEDV